MLAAAAAAGPARADYALQLDVAPYTVDQTVLGRDGWQKRLASMADNPDGARLVSVRWNGNKPAIVFKGASLKNSGFPRTQGDRAAISFQLALTAPETGNLRELRLWFGGAPIGEIFFDYQLGLGHGGLGTNKGGTSILPRAQVAPNTFYAFDILVDYRTRTYAIEVSGRKKDGMFFRYQAQDVPFEGNANPGAGIDSLYWISSPRLTAYLQGLKIESR